MTQTSKGDRNTTIGVVERGATLNVTYGQGPLPSGKPNPFGVPYLRNKYFTGRQSVLDRLHQQLSQGATAAITQVQAISGLGGIGKTQTAVEYAYRYHYDQRAYGAVFWVKSDTEVNLVTDFAGIANQLALPVAQATQEEKIPAVKSWLANHDSWLLIFDNADNPEWLVPYLPTNPKGRVLLTSRATLFDPVGIDAPLALDVLPVDDAIELLFARTNCQRSEEATAAARAINHELDGLPLALEQASAFIKQKRISFATYLTTFRKRGLAQLDAAIAQTGQYPSSVLKTWLLNIEAVAIAQPAAVELLEFSAFLAPDEIPYFLLQAVEPDVGDGLGKHLQHGDEDEVLLAIGELLDPLSQYSLVRWDAGRSYSVHRLVQAVMRDRLPPDVAQGWLADAISTTAQACPDEEFEHWSLCARLLPHWQQLVKQAKQSEFESEALGFLLDQAGLYLRFQGRYDEAEPLLTEALALRQYILGNEHPDVATSMNNLAFLYRSQGCYNEAETLYVSALALRRRILGNEHPDVATSMNNLAFLYDSQGRYNDAEPLYMDALALRRRILGDEHLNVATSMNNLAGLYYQRGRYGEAKPLYVNALALRRRILGEEHPAVAQSMNNLALLYKAQGHDSDAEPLLVRALALKRRILGDEHPDVALGMNNLAVLYEFQSRISQAETLYIEVLTLRYRVLGNAHPDVAISMNNLAMLYSSQKRYGKAEPLFIKAIALSRRILGNEHPDVALTMHNLANLYDSQGRYSDAEPLLAGALALRRRLLGDEHPDTKNTQSALEQLRAHQNEG